jgi:hypothetical protein
VPIIWIAKARLLHNFTDSGKISIENICKYKEKTFFQTRLYNLYNIVYIPPAPAAPQCTVFAPMLLRTGYSRTYAAI